MDLSAGISMVNYIRRKSSEAADAVGMLEGLRRLTAAANGIRQHRSKLQQQLAAAASIMSVQQLSQLASVTLGEAHTVLASARGPYQPGTQQQADHVAAAHSAYCAAEEGASAADLAAMSVFHSRLLSKAGRAAEGSAVLRRGLAAARACGDTYLEFFTAYLVFSALAARDGWRYARLSRLWRPCSAACMTASRGCPS